MFDTIKERLSRKGYLRKLADNLSSHRNRIPEAMNFNIRAINLNKEIENLFAGIIIADAIFDLVYKNFTQKTTEQEEVEFVSNTLSSGTRSNKEPLKNHKPTATEMKAIKK